MSEWRRLHDGWWFRPKGEDSAYLHGPETETIKLMVNGEQTEYPIERAEFDVEESQGEQIRML